MARTSLADARRSRFPELLAAVAIGVYILLVTGATTALLDAGAACPTWPACGDNWIISTTDPPGLLIAWAHRVVTLTVGGLLIAATAIAWRRQATSKVRWGLLGVTTLFPAQIAIGAITAVQGATARLAAVHLSGAMAIFTGVLLTLLWQLETETGEVAEESATSAHAGSTDKISGGRDDQSQHRPSGPLATIRAYVRLTKPKLWWLLCLVALAAMALAAGPNLDLGTVVATVIGGVLAIGASGVFNNVLERDIDRRMARTADRPVATAEVHPAHATVFGITLATASVAVFINFVNLLAATLGFLAVLFYSVGYTIVLKPNTTQNIVIGGAVGAFPALIGWAAVTDTVGIPAVILGAVIFLWTPAHFYNLALVYRDDYARAGVPMLPVVHGAAVTRRHVFFYLVATLLAAAALGAATDLGWAYSLVILIVGGVFLCVVIRLFRERTTRSAWRAFQASNAFLGSLLVAIVVDSIVI